MKALKQFLLILAASTLLLGGCGRPANQTAQSLTTVMPTLTGADLDATKQAHIAALDAEAATAAVRPSSTPGLPTRFPAPPTRPPAPLLVGLSFECQGRSNIIVAVNCYRTIVNNSVYTLIAGTIRTAGPDNTPTIDSLVYLVHSNVATRRVIAEETISPPQSLGRLRVVAAAHPWYLLDTAQGTRITLNVDTRQWEDPGKFPQATATPSPTATATATPSPTPSATPTVAVTRGRSNRYIRPISYQRNICRHSTPAHRSRAGICWLSVLYYWYLPVVGSRLHQQPRLLHPPRQRHHQRLRF
jgi:hypothetical protein